MSYLHLSIITLGCLGYLSGIAQSVSPHQYTIPVSSFIQTSDATLNNEAPPILFRDKPSVLIWIDGDPVITVDTVLRMYRILNTPHLIIKNHNDKKYYLYSDQGWYVSDSAVNGYVYRKNLPPVIQLMDSLVKRGKPNTIKRMVPAPPPVVISQEPAALICTKGKPIWKPIPGTTLTYLQNTEDHVFRDTVENKLYLTLSGRWYISQHHFDGPWSYCPAEQLPEGFKLISPTSPKSSVLVHVPGTEAAHQAVLKAQEFKTTLIPRRIDSSISVIFGGGPEFASITGSELFIAQNSNVPVVSYRDTYFALNKGAWYRGSTLSGPWEVSSILPPDINKLSSDHPFYYAKFVHIADTTEHYVEVGFTGGYEHTYIQNNTIVYGTGFLYNQWQRERFLPRPVTWYQGISYKEESGWVNRPLLPYYNFSLP